MGFLVYKFYKCQINLPCKTSLNLYPTSTTYLYIVSKYMKKIAFVALACVSTLILAGCGTQTQADPNADGSLNSFAQCTADKGLKMYGAERCPHCQKMKAMFGSAFSGVNFIDCDLQKVQCDAAGIEWYPTRSVNGQKYQGEKTLQEIATMTSCELPAGK